MMIDLAHFTAWSALAGGMLIGTAVLLLLLGIGRIAGISGVVGGVVDAVMTGTGGADIGWRLAFIAGLMMSSWLYAAVLPLAPIHVDTSNAGLVVAGLLVGFGTRLGGGCTSGHGVCGTARASSRSIVATLSFMGVGFVVVYAARHLFAGA